MVLIETSETIDPKDCSQNQLPGFVLELRWNVAAHVSLPRYSLVKELGPSTPTISLASALEPSA